MVFSKHQGRNIHLYAPRIIYMCQSITYNIYDAKQTINIDDTCTIPKRNANQKKYILILNEVFL